MVELTEQREMAEFIEVKVTSSAEPILLATAQILSVAPGPDKSSEVVLVGTPTALRGAVPLDDLKRKLLGAKS
jgi:hypothetical protein